MSTAKIKITIFPSSDPFLKRSLVLASGWKSCSLIHIAAITGNSAAIPAKHTHINAL